MSTVPKRRRVYLDSHNDKSIVELDKRMKESLHKNTSYDLMLKKYVLKIEHYINLFYELSKKIPRKENDCVIHGDFWDGQIIYDGAKVAALIDFDAVIHGNAGYDIAKGGISSFCRTFNPKGEPYSLKKLKLFLKAYAEVAEKPLNMEPKELMFFIIHGKLNGLNYFVNQIAEKNSKLVENVLKSILQLLEWCEHHELEIEQLFKETDNWIRQHQQLRC